MENFVYRLKCFLFQSVYEAKLGFTIQFIMNIFFHYVLIIILFNWTVQSSCFRVSWNVFFLCACPGTLPPLPPPPKKKKKRKKKKKAVVCLNKTEAKSLSLVGRLEAKFWIFFLCFVYRWLYVVGIDRVIQQVKINLFTPELPKTPCEDPIFLCLVLLVMSSVSQTIWHLLAQGANGLRWSVEFRYYVLGLRCVKSQT